MTKLVKESLNEGFGKTLTLDQVVSRFDNKEVDKEIERLKKQLEYLHNQKMDAEPGLYEIEDLLNELNLGMNTWNWVEPHSSGNEKVAVEIGAKGLNPSDKEQLKEDILQIIDAINENFFVQVADTERGKLFDGGDYFKFWII